MQINLATDEQDHTLKMDALTITSRAQADMLITNLMRAAGVMWPKERKPRTLKAEMVAKAEIAKVGAKKS